MKNSVIPTIKSYLTAEKNNIDISKINLEKVTSSIIGDCDFSQSQKSKFNQLNDRLALVDELSTILIKVLSITYVEAKKLSEKTVLRSKDRSLSILVPLAISIYSDKNLCSMLSPSIEREDISILDFDINLFRSAISNKNGCLNPYEYFMKNNLILDFNEL